MRMLTCLAVVLAAATDDEFCCTERVGRLEATQRISVNGIVFLGTTKIGNYPPRAIVGPRYGGLAEDGKVILVHLRYARVDAPISWQTRHVVGARTTVFGGVPARLTTRWRAVIELESATAEWLTVRVVSGLMEGGG